MTMTMFILPSIVSAPLVPALLSPGYALPPARPPQPPALLVPLELTDTEARLQTLAPPAPALAPAGVGDADTPTRPSHQLASLSRFGFMTQTHFVQIYHPPFLISP